jgi:hypothetical protein
MCDNLFKAKEIRTADFKSMVSCVPNIRIHHFPKNIYRLYGKENVKRHGVPLGCITRN